MRIGTVCYLVTFFIGLILGFFLVTVAFADSNEPEIVIEPTVFVYFPLENAPNFCNATIIIKEKTDCENLFVRVKLDSTYNNDLAQITINNTTWQDNNRKTCDYVGDVMPDIYIGGSNLNP